MMSVSGGVGRLKHEELSFSFYLFFKELRIKFTTKF